MARILIKKSMLMEYLRKSQPNKGNSDSRFEEFKKKVLEHLEKLEQREKTEVKKSLIAYETASIEKGGKGLPVGTIREWKGKKYIKIAPGKWKPKYDGETRGAKLAVAAIKRKAAQCTDSKELLQLILENKSRFADGQGKPLPFVYELSDYVSGLNDKIESGKATKIISANIEDFASHIKEFAKEDGTRLSSSDIQELAQSAHGLWRSAKDKTMENNDKIIKDCAERAYERMLIKPKEPENKDDEPLKDRVKESIFGKKFSGFKNMEAIRKLQKEKQGYVESAFSHDALGNIDLVWGKITDSEKKKGYGLAHIINKHPDFDLSLLPEIIKEGKAEKTHNGYNIIHDGYVVGINKNFKKDGKEIETGNWIVTSFKKGGENAARAYADTSTSEAVSPPTPNQSIPQSGEKSSGGNEQPKNKDHEKATNALNDNIIDMPKVDFSQESYDRLFPFGKVKTPIGEVKLGENQFAKLKNRDNRKELLGAMHKTLSDPAVILKEVDGDGKESRLYVRTYKDKYGNKNVMSVVVDLEGKPISISTGLRKDKQIERKIKMADSTLYIKVGASRSTSTASGLSNVASQNDGKPATDSTIPQIGEKSSGNNTAKQNENNDTNLSKLIEKFAGKKLVANAVEKASVNDFVSHDWSRPVMGGVYHEGGYEIATDGRILAMVKADYPKEYEGKLMKEGNEIEGTFPNYKRVIPENGQGADVSAAFGDMNGLLQRCIAGEKLAGKNGTVAIRVGGVLYNVSYMRKLLALAKKHGLTRFEQQPPEERSFRGDTYKVYNTYKVYKGLKAYNDKDGSCAVLMPMNDATDAPIIGDDGNITAERLNDEQKNKLSLGEEESPAIRNKKKSRLMNSLFTGVFSDVCSELNRLAGLKNVKIKRGGAGGYVGWIRDGLGDWAETARSNFTEKYGKETADKVVDAFNRMHEIYVKSREIEKDENAHSNDLKEFLDEETAKLKQLLGIKKALFAEDFSSPLEDDDEDVSPPTLFDFQNGDNQPSLFDAVDRVEVIKKSIWEILNENKNG